TTDGSVSNFVDDAIHVPEGIITGPDGALWFTNIGFGFESVGRITTDGTVSNCALPGSHPYNIAVGSDGALWFTNNGTTTVGRVTTGCVVSTYAAPANTGPLDIVSG